MTVASSRRCVAVALALAGCARAGAASDPPIASLRPACAGTEHFDGETCRPRGDAAALVDRGVAALQEFRVDEALAVLEQARAAGPHRHDVLVRIHEQLGIAYAYLERETDALAAFDMLLALDPGHLLSYTLSPKATFLFERARRAGASRPVPAIDVSWSPDGRVGRPVPLTVEVIADPKAFLRTARLYLRSKAGPAAYAAVDVALPTAGKYRRIVLPGPTSSRPEVLQLYLTALDDQGNEVLTWADPTRPREIALRYDPPVPWYRTWWLWAIAGGTVAATTGTTVFLLLRDPPETVPGTLILNH